jgi:hypothetical protein
MRLLSQDSYLCQGIESGPSYVQHCLQNGMTVYLMFFTPQLIKQSLLKFAKRVEVFTYGDLRPGLLSSRFTCIFWRLATNRR